MKKDNSTEFVMNITAPTLNCEMTMLYLKHTYHRWY